MTMQLSARVMPSGVCRHAITDMLSVFDAPKNTGVGMPACLLAPTGLYTGMLVTPEGLFRPTPPIGA